MTDMKTLKLYAQNRKLPEAVKLGTVPETWLTYAYTLARDLENTSDAALIQRQQKGVAGTEIEGYDALTEFYNQRYISRMILPNPIERLEGVHHLRFGVLEKDGVIPFHLDEPYTLRFICMIHGTHKFHVEDGKTYEMNPGELWFVNGSFKHSVENTSNGTRFALLGKFARNDINLRTINELL